MTNFTIKNLCLAISLFFICVGFNSRSSEIVKIDKELQVRNGLPNFFNKIARGEAVNVAYFGGSITEQEGWRVFSLNWFKERFPKAGFTEINAAIGGTGSDFGAFRLHDHVLAYKPDLVFVEFAVNDGDAKENKILRSMEGIVRQIWTANPKTDICFVYTLSEDKTDFYLNHQLAPSAVAMEKIAAHYKIPSITFGFEVVLRLKNKTLIFKGPSKERDGILVFSPDVVHPYPETGHKIYMEVLMRSFEKMQGRSQSLMHKLPVALMSDNLSNATFIDIDLLKLGSNWQRIDPKADSVLNIGGITKYLHTIAKTTTNGETLKIRFTGKAIGAVDILGPQACRAIEVSLDGKLLDTVKRFDPWCAWYRMNYFMFDQLEDKTHEITFKAIIEPFDKTAILNKNGAKMDDPKKYENNCWYLGKILLDGELVE